MNHRSIRHQALASGCSHARYPVLQRLRTTTGVARIPRRRTAPQTRAVPPSRSVPTGSSTGGTRWQGSESAIATI